MTNCKRNNFPLPQIKEKFNGIEVKFYKNEVNVTDNVPLNVPLKNKRQENILKDFFK